VEIIAGSCTPYTCANSLLEKIRYQAVWLVVSYCTHRSYGIVWSLTTFPLTKAGIRTPVSAGAVMRIPLHLARNSEYTTLRVCIVNSIIVMEFTTIFFHFLKRPVMTRTILVTMDDPKDVAVQFLKLVVDGDVDEAFQTYVDGSGKHHNVYTPAGFEALKAGMKQAEAAFPDKEFSVKQVLADNDKVVVFSHLKAKSQAMNLSVMHLFRIENGKIVELWDLGQDIPKEIVNRDGPF